METLYIQLDHVLIDFESGIEKLPQSIKKQYEGQLDKTPDLFEMSDPIPGSVASFNELSTLFETYIVSISPWGNPASWKLKLEWIKQHFGDEAFDRLILTHRKHLRKGEYLVDNRIRPGFDEFVGEHIHFGTEKFPNWYAVTYYLRNLKEMGSK